MGILVEVDMYSGLPNPTYELDDQAEKTLMDALAAKRLNVTTRSSASTGRLGYRGLKLHPINKPGVGQLHVFDGVIESVGGTGPSPGFMDVDAELEMLVLSLVKPGLRPEEFSFLQEEIEKNASGGVASNFGDYVLEQLPVYEPNKWNNDKTILLNNNCYNYANDKVTNSFAQPGSGSGLAGPYPPSCAGTGDAASRDGEIRIPNSDFSPAEGHIIALVTASQPQFKDYHWYRRDATGTWSHKPGRTQVKNTDNSGRIITDPSTCDRGPYESFCGYFHCIPSKVMIR